MKSVRRVVFVLMTCFAVSFVAAQSSRTCEALDQYDSIVTSRAMRMVQEEIGNVVGWLATRDFSNERELGRAISDYWNARFAPTIKRWSEHIPQGVGEAWNELVEYNRPSIRRERWGRTLLNQCTVVEVAGEESFVITQLFRSEEIKRDVCSCFRSRVNERSIPWLSSRMFR